MKEKPILFSGAMVRAVIAGKKTQTRRLVKRPARYVDAQWEQAVPHNPGAGAHELFGHCYLRVSAHDGTSINDCVMGGRERSPYEPGLRLWVKETWQAWNQVSHERDEWEALTREYRGGLSWAEWVERDGGPDAIEYRATSESVGPWTPAIHMPRWASRLTLEVTSIRVERLQEITEADILAEGITVDLVAEWCKVPWSSLPTLHDAWRVAWDEINGDRAAWASNPWVWVVGFKRIEAARAA